MSFKPCQDGSCDGSHCRKCGCHFADFYTTEKICDECQMEFEQRAETERETPLGEQIEEQGEILDPISGEWN